jgi:hypothetical protein
MINNKYLSSKRFQFYNIVLMSNTKYELSGKVKGD